ncbi:50S ribosomal protein L22 [bacterium]|nr:50S ribosomal protein L22 [bacterium]
MSIRAKLKYLRIAPRKVRLVADMIRGKTASEARVLLSFCNKKAALPLLKLLNSALANAKSQQNKEEDILFISKITVDEGPKLKRWRARSRGQAFEIQKKTSHISLVLDEITEKSREKLKKVTKKQEAVSEKKEVPKVESKEKEAKEKEAKEELIAKQKPKFKPEKETKKPTTKKIIPKMFRRKAF